MLGRTRFGLSLIRDGVPKGIGELLPVHLPLNIPALSGPAVLTEDGAFVLPSIQPFGTTELLAVAIPRRSATRPRILLLRDGLGAVSGVGLGLLPFGANPVIERSTDGLNWSVLTYESFAPVPSTEAVVGLYRVRYANP